LAIKGQQFSTCVYPLEINIKYKLLRSVQLLLLMATSYLVWFLCIIRFYSSFLLVVAVVEINDVTCSA